MTSNHCAGIVLTGLSHGHGIGQSCFPLGERMSTTRRAQSASRCGPSAARNLQDASCALPASPAKRRTSLSARVCTAVAGAWWVAHAMARSPAFAEFVLSTARFHDKRLFCGIQCSRSRSVFPLLPMEPSNPPRVAANDYGVRLGLARDRGFDSESPTAAFFWGLNSEKKKK